MPILRRLLPLSTMFVYSLGFCSGVTCASAADVVPYPDSTNVDSTERAPASTSDSETIPHTESDNRRLYGTNPPPPPYIQEVIQQADFFYGLMPSEGRVYGGYTVKEKYSNPPDSARTYLWACPRGPGTPTFSPNGQLSTTIDFPAGGAYKLKFHGNDGRISDADLSRAYVPRMKLGSSFAYAGKNYPDEVMCRTHVVFSTYQKFAIRILPRVVSTENHEYIRIRYQPDGSSNNYILKDVQILGSLNQLLSAVLVYNFDSAASGTFTFSAVDSYYDGLVGIQLDDVQIAYY